MKYDLFDADRLGLIKFPDGFFYPNFQEGVNIVQRGNIFSIESMGLVDGPGIRCVVFMSGCPLRCAFCHNPESWDESGKMSISPDELLKKVLKFKPYFDRSGGGVTFSGGEPLMQPEFLIKCLSLLKKEGIHTALDTSGVGDERYFEKILSLCDMVLYDVKATDDASYKKLCKGDIRITESFQRALDKSAAKIIVRQVVIPRINDTDEYMKNLKEYIKTNLPRCEKVELLPFHKSGEHKYKAMGKTFPLADTEEMTKERTEYFMKYFEDIRG